MGHSRRTVVGLLGAWAAVGCTGTVVTPRGAGISLPKDTPVATSGARRLSKDEYDNTLADLLGDTTRSGFAVLPEDAHDPFDNNYLTQLASPALIDAAETLATDAMARVLADDAKRAALFVQAQQLMAESAAFVWLTYDVSVFAHRTSLRPALLPTGIDWALDRFAPA